MKPQFEANIIAKKLFDKKQKLLLAISGGVDSVVMAHLLGDCGFNFSMAHCNFKLRGKDSDADERFCRALAAKMKVGIFVTSFDTKKWAEDNGQSTQMAARYLRYEWFAQLMKDKGFELLLTAHHAGDLTETVLINLLRGTGIKGMKGIVEKREDIVRPFLQFTKEEISGYAKQNKLKFRLDKSNLEDKYDRNFLRHHVIPKLKQLNPSLESTFLRNSYRFSQEAGLLNDALNERKKLLLEEKNNEWLLDLEKLKAMDYRETLLHYILSPFGFNETQLEGILNCAFSPDASGKLFFSPTHKAAINRGGLVVRKNDVVVKDELQIASLNALGGCGEFTVKKLKAFMLPGANELLLDPARLVFPLVLRHKKEGDKFRPFGMKGFKLLSDFMREEKMNAFEKENCRLLVNGNGDIIWVLGRRSDERYRVNKNDTSLLKLALAKH